MAFKIALNAGHGLNTAGKRCLKSLDKNETREWTLNSRICNRIQEKLKDYDGYELLRLDDITGKTDIALKTRTDRANNFKADFYLSIHHNAGINGGKGGGIETYIYTKASSKSYEWQNVLYEALIKHTGLKGNRSDGTRQENLHEVRESNMPAVLIECGYMDSATDVPIILSEKYADACATAIVEVLVQRGGLIKKPIVEEAPKVEENLNKDEAELVKKLYRVRKSWEDTNSQVGAYETLENAIVKAKQTECNVYDSDGKTVWEYVEFIEPSAPPIEEIPKEFQNDMQEVVKDNPQEVKVNSIVDIVLKVLKKIAEIFLNYFKKE